MTPLLPPDRFASGRYWLRVEGMEIVGRWEAASGLWSWLYCGGLVSPEEAWANGYTFASPHRIPTAEQMDAVYALTAPPKPPTMPASAFAIGYHAGMEYAARKLREALGVTL